MKISVIIDSVKKSLLHNTTSCCIILKKWKLQQVLVLFIIYCLLYRTKILSICQFVTLITHLGLLTSTYQLPNTINLSFSASSFSLQVNTVVSIRSAAGWRRSGENSSNILLSNGSMGRATELHSGSQWFRSSWWVVFFFNITLFSYMYMFFFSAFIPRLLGIPSMHWSKIKRISSGNSIT